MKAKYKKVLLIIMDGWGKEIDKSRSAIANANTPNVDKYYKQYPNSELITFGKKVGLPEGQMGNSEVGHMNIGAGRIVFQDFMHINNEIKNDTFINNTELLKLFTYSKENNKALHLMGLFSDGGVHSHIDHLIALCKYAHNFGLQKIYIHAFTDGRDCAPDSGKDMAHYFEEQTKNYSCKIVSVIGRYYAMDRDKRWERVKLAYDLMVNAKGEQFNTALDAVLASYKNNVSDEFITPKAIVSNEKTTIQEGDAVLSFNFRTDRCRELTEVLTQQDMPAEGMKTIPLYYVSMTKYKDTYTNVPVLFNKDNLINTLGEIIEKSNKTQLRIAETEKYPHVTFFFSGGREKVFTGETRKVVASPKVATYDLQPEMSALEIKDKVITEIQENNPDFIVLNFANSDMVGHTGIFEAAVKAVETVDKYVGEVVESALLKDYDILVTADHGNSDIMINENGTVNTAHTKNMVPLFYISKDNNYQLKNGKLADLAPTILSLMGIEIPQEMDGKVLVY
tara:strand:- start:2602 stop:4125 length:1524 start_codon:yes stop_codon:yes gene_type:complete